MNRASAVELFFILAGVVAFLLLRAAPPAAAAGIAAVEPEELWGTPYYLRYNVPVATNRQGILPRTNPLSFGLGVPASNTVATGQWGI